MDPSFYKVISTETDNQYRYELVESGGRQGVRCVIYLTKNDILNGIYDLYDNNKYGYHFRKFMSHRYPELVSYKFDSIVWCWPYDKFDYEIGKEMAKERVDEKIKYKQRKIKNFIHHLERNNLPKHVLKKIEDIRNS